MLWARKVKPRGDVTWEPGHLLDLLIQQIKPR